MIAGGQNIEAIAEQLVGQLRIDPKTTGGVLDIRDRQVDVLRRCDVFEMPRNHAAAGRGEHVANKQKIRQPDGNCFLSAKGAVSKTAARN
jgi:hypothetical protein